MLMMMMMIIDDDDDDDLGDKHVGDDMAMMTWKMIIRHDPDPELWLQCKRCKFGGCRRYSDPLRGYEAPPFSIEVPITL